MASLFQGDPQKATSYTTSSSETPKWMQDAIYNQIQLAQNVANTPYQAYQLPTVAELSPLQQQAYQQVQSAQGTWKPSMDAATSGMQALTQSPGGMSAASPYFDQSRSMDASAGNADTANALKDSQDQYLRQGLVDQNLNAGQNYWNRAGDLDAVGAASPYLQQASSQDIIGAASPYMSQSAYTTAQALSDKALTAANPYLQSAAQSSVHNINQYMNPYTQNVTDQIAKLGARNLTENLLPGVSDAFIKAGSFGGSRMGEFGERALRDTQDSILNQQAQALQQGYAQSLNASQADLARQAQLAGAVGSISGADLSRVLQGAGQYSSIGQSMGQLTGQQAQNFANVGQSMGQLTDQQIQNLAGLGKAQTAAGQAQQQFGLNSVQQVQAAQQADLARQLQAASQIGQLGVNAGSLSGSDLTRQQSALTSLANLGQTGQQMRYADTAALESAGQAQQAQQQSQLNAAKEQFLAEQAYPKQQLDWLSTQVRGMAPIVPTTTYQSGSTNGATYSPSGLSQLAAGLAGYKALTT